VYACWKRLFGHFVRVNVKVYPQSVVDVQTDRKRFPGSKAPGLARPTPRP
jgi:hypothetical protein